MKSDILLKSMLIDYYDLEGKDYVFEVNPVAKPRMTQRDKWASRPCVVKYWAFKDEMLLAAIDMMFKLPDQFLITYNIPFPKSYSKKKRAELVGTPHKMKPDIDNLNKAILDTFMVEDSSVWSNWPRKFWSENPSIVITV